MCQPCQEVDIHRQLSHFPPAKFLEHRSCHAHSIFDLHSNQQYASEEASVSEELNQKDRLKNYKTLAYPEIDRERGFEEA